MVIRSLQTPAALAAAFLGLVLGSGAMPTAAPQADLQEEGYKLIYDNGTMSGHWYRPGAHHPLTDWGRGSGGTIGKLEIRYVTSLADPGGIVIRFYQGTDSTCATGKLLWEHRVRGANGSPDGGDYAFVQAIVLPPDKRFELPPGPFGYSVEFAKDGTGAELARGGAGNENLLWVNHAGPHRTKDPNAWAGLYLKLYALATGYGRIRIEPPVLVCDGRGESRPGGCEFWCRAGNDASCAAPNNPSSLRDTVRCRQVYHGQGVAIAVVDTGIDCHHPQLGAGAFPSPKVIGGWDFGDGDADPRPLLPHGTYCALVAAGDAAHPDGRGGGVAYGAKLYALKIKGELEKPTQPDTLAAALNWCVEHQYDDPLHPILVVSISYGGKRAFATCDGLYPALTAAANDANQAGITVLAASGNDGWTSAVDCPACLSPVIAVGGTRNRLVTPWSNTSGDLDILAPTDWDYVDTSADTGRGSRDTFGETSAACAYAAGAVACLQSAAQDLRNRFLAPDEVRSLLMVTGDSILDTRTTGRMPQINLDRAVARLCWGRTFKIHNDGTGVLNISAIAGAERSDWFSLWTKTPLAIPPGRYREVCVGVRPGSGPRSARLTVFSDDPNQDRNGRSVLLCQHDGRLP
jgi:hypothetical protein